MRLTQLLGQRCSRFSCAAQATVTGLSLKVQTKTALLCKGRTAETRVGMARAQQIPLARIKRAMKDATDVKAVSAEASYLVARATVRRPAPLHADITGFCAFHALLAFPC